MVSKLNWRRNVFVFALLVGTVLRFIVPLRSYHQDMVYWKEFVDVALAGGSVYRETIHPYGPVWIWILTGLESARSSLLPHSPSFPKFFPGVRSEDPATYDLHFVVVVPLTLADLVTTWVLFRRYGRRPALFFYLNPCTIYITGYQSQIDGLAVAFGVIGIDLLSRLAGEARPWLTGVASMTAGVLLGISLAVKHVLLFFPAIFVAVSAAFPLRTRLTVAAVAVAVFLASFFPYLATTAEADFIFRKIFLYSGKIGTGLVCLPLNLIGESSGVDWPANPSAVTAVKMMFFILVTAAMVRVRSADPLEFLLVYLIALTAFSPSVAPQYFVIPIVALARYSRFRVAWVYSALASLLFPINMITPKLLTLAHLPAIAGRWADSALVLYTVLLPLLQVCLVVLLIQIVRDPSRPYRSGCANYTRAGFTETFLILGGSHGVPRPRRVPDRRWHEMRVVYLNPVGEVGGAELSLLDLMASVAEATPGVERHLIVAGDGPLIGKAEVLGVTVHVLPLPESLAALGDFGLRDRGRLGKIGTLFIRGVPVGLAVRGYTRRLKALLHELDPTIVHSNGIKTHILLKLSGFDEAPVIWHVRDFYGPRPLMARALGWACGGVSRAIAISGAVGRDAEAILEGVPVTVVYNAIDTVRFAPGVGDGARLDGLAGLPPALEGTVRVGLVATYARWKGQDLFMIAISQVQSVRPARFYIVGGPIYKTKGSQFSVEELRELAGKLGVADRLAFVPFQAETADAFRALDVVIHASTHPEPFGRTIVEAMACSRPVVVANAGGASELFTEGKDALGVTPGDPDALAQAMDRLIDNDTERHQIGECARATALTRYARERLGRDIADVYAQLTAPPM